MTVAEVTSAIPVSRLPAVNVACVPQRSPLRYPGGKTWLIPHIREWLSKTGPRVLVEPFAGGAIVSLTAVMEDLVDEAVMIELDHDVAAFWHAALRYGDGLANRVREFSPTRENLVEWDTTAPQCLEDHGFRTLILNRTRRAGILAPGASFMREGENGKGVLSRWYPDTLAARLSAISGVADRLTFFEGDGLSALPALLHGWGKRAAVFVDPPYTAPSGKRAGSRLYTADVDHERLFSLLARHSANFVMTYDNAPGILSLVDRYGFYAVAVEMKSAHHRLMRELVITRDPMFS